MGDHSKLFWRRVALAPVCLILVAALHLYRVTYANQSPWKGGGFGMFSTVDAPNARFVRAYVVTAAGRRPIALPERVARLASKLRTAPSDAHLQELARRLAAQKWIDDYARWESIGQRIAAHSPESPIAAITLRNRSSRDHEPLELPLAMTSGLVAAASVDQRRERGDIVPFSTVEVELWRYEYDSRHNVLSARQLAHATAPAEAAP